MGNEECGCDCNSSRNCSCLNCNCCACSECGCNGKTWPSSTKTRMVKISKVREEFQGNKTFYMDEEMSFLSGQFVMVWLPGMDEKPIALIPWEKKYALNIEGKGNATKKMLEKKQGEFIGIRGPYGKPFSVEGVKKAVIVAGGIGIDSIIMLAQRLHENGCKTKIVLGGRNKERIIFEKELNGLGELFVATDDGSYGEKGYNTVILERVLQEGRQDMVYACGPEPMMVKALGIAKKNGCEFQCSVERHMKCGIGICGECVINDRLVCSDGPVFSGKELEQLTEFGKTAYLKSGKRVSLEEYYAWRQK